MPRKVPDDSSATRKSGRLDRSSRAGSAEEAEAAALERAASVARTWRTPYTAPALPPAVIAPATSSSVSTYPGRRTPRRFYSNAAAPSGTLTSYVAGPDLRLFDVPQANRRGSQAHQVLGQHLQLRPREAGLLLGGLLGQPPAER